MVRNSENRGRLLNHSQMLNTVISLEMLKQILTAIEIHKPGRPKKTEQLYLREKILTCFQEGIDPLDVAVLIGVNIKTVYKYHKDWITKRISYLEADFLKRQQEMREQAMSAYNMLIFETFTMLRFVNHEIKTQKELTGTVPLSLISKHTEIVRNLSNLIKEKTSFAMEPIMHEALEKKIKELIEKYGQP